MKTFKVRVVWRHTIEDYADVEIEATSAAAAKVKAALLLADSKAVNDLDWEDGEVVEGEYLVESVKLLVMAAKVAAKETTEEAVRQTPEYKDFVRRKFGE